MRPKSILLLTLALGCGLIASIGIGQITRNRGEQGAAAEMVAIFVAAVDINAGDPIDTQMLQVKEWPVDAIPEGAITKLEDMKDKRTRQKIFANEPIVEKKLIAEGEMELASMQIPPGYRVVSVRVDAVSGGASLIQPNDRVDMLVHVTRNPGLGISQTSTKTILQDLKVFAVDNVYAGKPDSQGEQVVAAKTISLLVTLPQAEKVTLATEMGNIRLVMRSPGDAVAAETAGARAPDIFGDGESTDRKAEEEHKRPPQEPAVASKSFLDLIAGAMKAKPAAEQGTDEPGTQVAEAETFKMLVMSGSELREIEFAAGTGLPTTIDRSSSQAPAAASPAADGATEEAPELPFDPAKAGTSN